MFKKSTNFFFKNAKLFKESFENLEDYKREQSENPNNPYF